MPQFSPSVSFTPNTPARAEDVQQIYDDTSAFLNGTKLDAQNIQNGAIVNQLLAAGAVTLDKMAPGSVGAAQYVDGSLTGAKLGVPIGVRGQRTTNQGIAGGGAEGTVTFPTENFDSDEMFDPAEPGRITFTRAGIYTVTFGVIWQANTDGRRRTVLRLNGATELPAGDSGSATAQPYVQAGSLIFNASAGNYVEVRVQQTSGTSLNINPAHLAAIYHGPAS